MQEVLNIIKQIASVSGRNEKESLLAKYKGNHLLLEVLKFVYDPFILTGLSSKKINKDTYLDYSVKLNTVEEVMQYLKKNNTGKDIDIANVQHFIYRHDEKLQEFFKQVFTKELKIGLTSSTLNKVYGKGFIKEFSVMLAKKFEDHRHKITGDFVITEKLDGGRIVVLKDNGIVKSLTRQGKLYEGLEEIESDISNLPIDNIVFDGELIADTEGNTHEIYTETMSKSRSKGSNKTGLLFHIFDMLPLDEFQKGQSKEKCITRKNKLSQLFAEYNFSHCREVKPLYIGSDLSQVDVWMEYASQQGWEGLMVNLDKPYVCKRSDYILKVKTMNTCDLRIIGFEQGSGKYIDKLGALIVDYKGNRVGVGSGFTDYDREYIWNNQSEYLNKIIEVQYFEQSTNQDGGISLRFPVYKKLRLDKDKPSYN